MKGYFRCRHCDTLLKQATSDNLVGQFKKGYWTRYALITLAMFGLLWATVYLFEQWSPSLAWLSFVIIILLLASYVAVMNKVKHRYWIIEEVDREEDQKQAPRMGVKGWMVLLTFIGVCFAGFVFIERYVDVSDINYWIYTLGMVIAIMIITGGSIGIFKYFSVSGDSG